MCVISSSSASFRTSNLPRLYFSVFSRLNSTTDAGCGNTSIARSFGVRRRIQVQAEACGKNLAAGRVEFRSFPERGPRTRFELGEVAIERSLARSGAGLIRHDQGRIDGDQAFVSGIRGDRRRNALVVSGRADVQEAAVGIDNCDTGLAFLHPTQDRAQRSAYRKTALRGVVSCVFVTIPNVLANRYASDEMVAIWSPEAKVVAERRLWLAVLRAQAELGVRCAVGRGRGLRAGARRRRPVVHRGTRTCDPP